MGISFKNVDHYYPGVKRKDYTVALKDINIDIDEKDEFIAIVGKTGSGKSTLMQHMNALKLPSKGNVLIFDNLITPNKRKNPKLKGVRKRVGYVFQFPEYQLFEETVLKDIMFAPLNFGFSKEEAKEKAIEAAKLLGVDKILNKSPRLEVNSKSITSSSRFKYLIGSSPTFASIGNSHIPSISSGFKNLLSNPSSAIEQIIPFDSQPLITPFLISPPGSLAPSRATITFKPFLTLGAPHTISNTSLPTLTLHTCK